MKDNRMKYILLYGIGALPLIVTLFVFNKLPDQIPLHWDINGNVNNYGDKIPFAFLLPLMPIAIPALMNLTAKVDPRKANYAFFKGSYYLVQLAIMVLFVVINFVTLSSELGYNIVRVDTLVKAAVGLLITVMGNQMPRFKHNYFIGIRTPWTLANEEVWFKTHRFGGKLWFFGGLVMMAFGFIPGMVSGVLYICTIFAISMASLLYSYVEFRRVKP